MQRNTQVPVGKHNNRQHEVTTDVLTSGQSQVITTLTQQSRNKNLHDEGRTGSINAPHVLIYWLAYLFDDTYQLTMASIIMNNTLIQYVWCIYISCSCMIIWFWLDKKEMLSSVTTAHLPLITSPMPCSSPACPYTSSTSDLQIATSFWPNLGSDTVSRLCGACPAVIRPKHKHNLVTEVRLELISKQNNYTYWFYIYSLPGVFSCISFIMRQQYRALKSIY